LLTVQRGQDAIDERKITGEVRHDAANMGERTETGK
jgi:hypothetical protein